MNKQLTLLTPGVLQVSPRVWEAFGSVQLSHRDPVVLDYLKEIENNLKRALKLSDQYRIVFLSATGRGANEAVLSALSAANKKILVPVNGRWGLYLVEIAKRYSSKVVAVEYDEDKPFSPGEIRKALEQHRPDVLAFAAHETESGILNPVGEIVKLCREFDCTVALDAMSAVVVENIDYEKLAVDVFVFSSAKAIRSTGWVGMVAIRTELAEQLPHSINHYLDLREEYDMQTSGKLPRRPILPSAVLALLEASRELLEEGVDKRRNSITKRTDYIKDWARGKGLRFCAEERYLGNFTVPLYLPEGWKYDKFSQALKKRGYFVLYGPEGDNGRTFTVCAVGYVSMEDVQGFTRAVDSILL